MQLVGRLWFGLRGVCGARRGRSSLDVVRQRRRKVFHGCIAVAGFLGDCIEADRLQAGIDGRAELRWRRSVDVQYQADDFRDRPLKRPTAAEQFVKYDSQAVDVGGRADRLAVSAGLFRRHVGRRPHDLPAVTDLSVARVLPAGETEVHDHRFALAVDHDVRGLEVAMDDPFVMGFLQRQGQFADYRHDLAVAQLRFRLQHLRQRLAVDERQHDVVAAVDRADFVDRADLGMVETGGRAGLRGGSVRGPRATADRRTSAL